MPLIRKLVTIGNAKGITFPKSWIDYYEKTNGQKLEEVLIETKGNTLIITAINISTSLTKEEMKKRTLS